MTGTRPPFGAGGGKPDALTQIALAAVAHQRPFSINWVQPYDGPTFPSVALVIDGKQWSVFFKAGARGWALVELCTSTRRRTGLAKTLSAISANAWDA